MNQLLLILVIGAAFSNAEEEPFSIGLGVLSPSYSQKVGKENVQVRFDQKDNGQFSYSVGDPKSGTNTYLNFGPSAQGQAGQASGYAPQQATGYAAPQASGYAAPQASGYAAPAAAPASGYQPVNFVNNPGYASPNHGAPSGYSAPSPSSGYYGNQVQDYNSYPSSPQAGSYGNAARQPSNSAGFLPAGFSYHATEGQAFLRQSGELRKPEGNGVLPAGFSYHAMDGQSFLRQGGTPNFIVEDEKKNSPRGPAEDSFYQNFKSNSQQGGAGAWDGLVGYGPGGPRGNIPVGGYAGAEFQGAHKEHGGHQ